MSSIWIVSKWTLLCTTRSNLLVLYCAQLFVFPQWNRLGQRWLAHTHTVILCLAGYQTWLLLVGCHGWWSIYQTRKRWQYKKERDRCKCTEWWCLCYSIPWRCQAKAKATATRITSFVGKKKREKGEEEEENSRVCKRTGIFSRLFLGDLIFPPLNKRRELYTYTTLQHTEIETSSSCPRCIYFFVQLRLGMRRRCLTTTTTRATQCSAVHIGVCGTVLCRGP